MSKRAELTRRIEDLRTTIAECEADGSTAAAQRQMLARYEAELDDTPVEVETGNAGIRHALTARPKAGSAASNQYGTFTVSYATQKQTNYIKMLLDTRDTRGVNLDLVELYRQVADTQVNKKAASAIIDFLLDLPELSTQSLGEPATDKQKAFVRVLLAEREGIAEAEAIRAMLNRHRETNTLTAKLLSAIIEELLTVAPTRVSTVPDGRYALPAEDGHFVFYRVESPQDGKWVGYTFVSQLIGSVGDWTEQRLSQAVSRSVRDRIAANVEEAARMFGIKARACSYCHSPLSQIQSRAAGYGEQCAENHGFYYPTLEEAKTILAERGEVDADLEDHIRSSSEMFQEPDWNVEMEAPGQRSFRRPLKKLPSWGSFPGRVRL